MGILSTSSHIGDDGNCEGNFPEEKSFLFCREEKDGKPAFKVIISPDVCEGCIHCSKCCLSIVVDRYYTEKK